MRGKRPETEEKPQVSKEKRVGNKARQDRKLVRAKERKQETE